MSPDVEQMAQSVIVAMKAALRTALAPVVTRVAVLEAREPIQGKDGAAGRDGVDGKDGLIGPPGRDGIDGKDGVGTVGPVGERGEKGEPGIVPPDLLDAVHLKIAGLETRLSALPVDLEPDAVSASLSELLRKELPVFTALPMLKQKRVIRNEQGKIERVVEEPATV